MWIPPWSRPYALGAFGLAPAEDRILADRVSAAVAENIAAGRPFYDPAPPEFKAKFQQYSRSIYNYVLGHKDYMPKGLAPDEQELLAVKVVNKTYYNALRGIAEYRGEASLKGWFFKIARNALIDELRMFIRSPRGRQKIMTYSRDSASDAQKTKALRAEAEAAVGSEAFSLTDEGFQRAAKLIVRMQQVGHDLAGREFISGEDATILKEFVRARGNIEVVDARLRIDNFDKTQEALDSALDRLQGAVTRLTQTLAARGESI